MRPSTHECEYVAAEEHLYNPNARILALELSPELRGAALREHGRGTLRCCQLKQYSGRRTCSLKGEVVKTLNPVFSPTAKQPLSWLKPEYSIMNGTHSPANQLPQHHYFADMYNIYARCRQLYPACVLTGYEQK